MFIIDVVNSSQLIVKLKRYAEENDVIVHYEKIKADIRKKHDENRQKYHFFHPFRTRIPLSEHLKDLKESFEQRKRK